MGYETVKSERAYQHAERVIAGGVNSGARGPDAGWLPSPPVVARGEGAELWDVDGNRYVDHLLALGPMIHGHAHPEMTQAVSKAISSHATHQPEFAGYGGGGESQKLSTLLPKIQLSQLAKMGSRGSSESQHSTVPQWPVNSSCAPLGLLTRSLTGSPAARAGLQHPPPAPKTTVQTCPQLLVSLDSATALVSSAITAT